MVERKIALITGASRGIGAATAHELARRGYALALVARSAEPLLALAGTLTRASCPTLPIIADLAHAPAAQQVAQTALAHFGRVDVLVNNAGIGSAQRTVAELNDDDVDSVLATNLYAPIALTRALLPQMLTRRSGSVIFVSSVAGHIALPRSSMYTTSKFGLRAFATSLRREVARHGVGVSVVSPGFIATAMTQWLRFVPMPGPEIVARVIADCVEHPRRDVVVPGYYRLAIWSDHFAPWLTDALMRVVR